jgi:hypothetical protein
MRDMQSIGCHDNLLFKIAWLTNLAMQIIVTLVRCDRVFMEYYQDLLMYYMFFLRSRWEI